MTAAPAKKRLKNMKNMWTCYQMDEIIGQGERLAIKILSEIYPKAILAKQVPLRELLFMRISLLVAYIAPFTI